MSMKAPARSKSSCSGCPKGVLSPTVRTRSSSGAVEHGTASSARKQGSPPSVLLKARAAHLSPAAQCLETPTVISEVDSLQ